MVEIKEVSTKKEMLAFIELPLKIYQSYPLYCPQLTFDLKKEFSPKNPFFNHASVKFFLAYQGKECVGRITSIVNDNHLKYQKDGVGFFGFFEATNNHEVSSALLDAAAGELRKSGLKTMRGPMNFSTNEECGVAIDNFTSPPVIMMPYNPPYYENLMVNYGFSKAKDLYAYIYDVLPELPEKVLRVASIAEKKGITVRLINFKDFVADLRKFKELYNATWAKNWGFVPMTNEEIDFIGKKMKQIAVNDLIVLAEKDGETIGFLGMIPDFNYVLSKMKGKLNPVTILKALYYSKKIKTLRLLLLGTRPEFQKHGVDALMFREGFKGVKRGKYANVEFSWILEDNLPVQMLIKMIGGRHYKTYRIYEKPL